MAITYTPTTNFGAKDSLPTNDPDKVIKGSEFTTEFTALQTAFSLAAPNASPTFTGTVTIPTADINGGAIDGTTIGGTTPAAATFTSVTATTADINGGNIDGTVIGAATPAAGSFTTLQADTSLNVDGTVTADGLTVDGDGTLQNTGDGFRTLKLSGNRSASGVTTARVSMQWDGNEIARIQSHGGTDTTNKDEGDLLFYTADAGVLKIRQTIDQNGDISFYEDTGTTPKFFWDASAERLGLGTTSPSRTLTVAGIQGWELGGTEVAYLNPTATGTDFALKDASGFNVVRLDGRPNGDVFFNTGGNVGIGTSSPGPRLEVKENGAGETVLLRLRSDDGADQGFLDIAVNATNNETIYKSTGSARGQHVFSDGLTERARLDASGNLLVGVDTNTTTTSAEGFVYNNGGSLLVTRDGAPPAYFTRLSSDGDIAVFRKGTATVGSIGTVVAGAADQLYINSDDVGLRFRGSDDSIVPCTSAGTFRDAAIDLGLSSGRFKDLYLSGYASVNALASPDGTSIVFPTNAGYVGIGTSTTNEKLVLGSADSGSNFLQITNSTTTAADNRGFYVGIDANEAARILNRENTDMVFSTNDAEAMRLDASGNLLVGASASAPAAADATAVRYGIGVQAGSLSSVVSLTAGTAADVIDLTDVIDGSQNGAGMWLVSIVRDNASYGTHFVGIFGANNTSIALYHTLVATGITVTVSGTTIKANPTSATDTYNTNAIPLSITG